MLSSLSSYVAHFGLDTAVLLGACTLLTMVGLIKGKKSLVVALFSTYGAIVSTFAFPYYETVVLVAANGEANAVAMRTLVLLVTGAVFFFSTQRFFDTTFSISPFWRFMECSLLAVSLVCLVVAAFVHVVGIEAVYALSPYMSSMFSTPDTFFAWITAPIFVCILFVRR